MLLLPARPQHGHHRGHTGATGAAAAPTGQRRGREPGRRDPRKGLASGQRARGGGGAHGGSARRPRVAAAAGGLGGRKGKGDVIAAWNLLFGGVAMETGRLRVGKNSKPKRV